MKKTIILVLSALMLLALAACGQKAEEKKEDRENAAEPSGEENTPLPDSVLYYGEITGIENNEDGSIARLYMNSQSKGEWVMNLSEDCIFFDSGNFRADETPLSVGDRAYVFHSPIMTMSLPPQSPAFALVRNIPMDARCAMYHEIEEVSETEKGAAITTDNGEMIIYADSETEIYFYSGEKAELKDIEPGGFMMVLYREIMNQAPADPEAYKIMLLP